MANDWSRDWTAQIGWRIREARLRRGLSTQDVADRTAALGYPMARASIGNLETRPRTKIYLQDVVILAAALGVPPIELLYPLEPVLVRSSLPGPLGEGPYATLKNHVAAPIPGRTEEAFRAAGWFTGAYGRSLELRIAAMTAVARFAERERLLSTLLAEDEAGQLRESAAAVGAPPPDEFLPVLRMEVYDLAVAAERACQDHEDVAAKARDEQPSVSAEDRARVARYAADKPDPYIADPAERPDVKGVFGIGDRVPPLPDSQADLYRLRQLERIRPSSYYERGHESSSGAEMPS